MDANLAQDKIKKALKVLLKKREHTYNDVAKVWNCSVPTVKRQLGAEELSLARLLQLLEWLDLSLGEVEKLSEADTLMHPKFTTRQMEFLGKDLRALAFMMKLYEDLTPQQIAKKYKMDPAVADKILIQLEKYDLIRVGAGGKVKPFYSRLPNFDGTLAMSTIRRQIDCMASYSKIRIEETIAQRQRGLKLPPGEYSWTVAEVSEKTYLDFFQRFRKELENLSEQAKLDGNSLKKSEMKMAVISFGSQLDEVDSPTLALVTQIFDEYLRTS